VNQTESFSAAVAAQSFVEHTANKSNTPSERERREHVNFSFSFFYALLGSKENVRAQVTREYNKGRRIQRIAFTLAQAAYVYTYKR